MTPRTPLSAPPHRPDRDAYYRTLRQEYHRRYKAFDPFTFELLYDLVQAVGHAEGRLGVRLLKEGMTIASLNVLVLLRPRGETGLPLNEISHLLFVTRANITGLVDHLVQKGFVRREGHEKDRRVILAKITRAGVAWMDRFLPGHYALVREHFAPLSSAEKRAMIRLLNKVKGASHAA